MLMPPELQALDGFNAANYLRAQPNVGGEPIGVIGFSHGGWAVLKAVLADMAGQASVKPFVAAVAFYPGCDPSRSALTTDTLILIGEADDWTPVDRCARWRDAVERNGHSLQMKAYPGALHFVRRAGDAAYLRWPLYRTRSRGGGRRARRDPQVFPQPPRSAALREFISSRRRKAVARRTRACGDRGLLFMAHPLHCVVGTKPAPLLG